MKGLTRSCMASHSQGPFMLHAFIHFFMTFNVHNSMEEKHETKVRIGFGSLIDNSYASVTVNTPTG